LARKSREAGQLTLAAADAEAEAEVVGHRAAASVDEDSPEAVGAEECSGAERQRTGVIT
jgi:hypothetical protein